MGARTIRTGIGTYRNTDGRWTHGFLGDEVEVHEDDLEPKPTRSTRGSKKQ